MPSPGFSRIILSFSLTVPWTITNTSSWVAGSRSNRLLFSDPTNWLEVLRIRLRRWSRSTAEVRRRLISIREASRALEGLETENGGLGSTSDVRIRGSPLPKKGALQHAPVKRVQGSQYRVLGKGKANHGSPPILPVARMVKRRVPVGPSISISVVFPSAVPVLSKVIRPRTAVVLRMTSG